MQFSVSGNNRHLEDIKLATKNKFFIVKSFRLKFKDNKLPLLRPNFRSPREIPKEYLFLDIRKNLNSKYSKTPSPCKQIKYSVPKDFIKYTINKIQHRPIVEDLSFSKQEIMLRDYEQNKSKVTRVKDFFMNNQTLSRDNRVDENKGKPNENKSKSSDTFSTIKEKQKFLTINSLII